MVNQKQKKPWIIFDCGGVIIDIHFGEPIKRLAAACGTTVDEIKEIYSYDISDPKSPKGSLEHYSAGRINTNQFIREMLYVLPQRIGEEEFIEADQSILGADKHDTINLVNDLKSEGFQCGIFSNTTELHWQHLRSERLWFPLFSPIFASHEVGLLKPDEEVFKYMESKLGAHPSECVLIDDLEKNVVAANRRGWTGIHFTSAQQARDALNKLA